MNGDDDGARLREGLVAQLVGSGALHSGAWIDTFTRVPRHPFLRRFFRQTADHSGWEAVDGDDPGAREEVYRDATWVTQLDHDPHRWWEARETGVPVSGVPTSSSTAPGLMALMLETLDVRDGHRVLEVGTGTGYHAALLSQRLGGDRVSTVEVDADVAAGAEEGLRACGYAPTVVVADGAAGHPPGAPYDRLVATCAVPTVPPAWLAQVRPGGQVVTSVHRELGGGPLVRLHVDDEGGAKGRFLPQYGGFMPLHHHPAPDAAARLAAALDTGAASAERWRVSEVDAAAVDDPDFGMVAALHLPDVASVEFVPAHGPQRWLLAADGSWACVDVATRRVRQHGDRCVWEELERAYHQWRRDGAPERQRYGLTVAAGGEHRVWLDSPEHVRVVAHG